MKAKSGLAWGAVLCLFFSSPCFATNGIRMIGFGTESIAVAGADIPLARDTFALNINPAGLTSIASQQFDIDLGFLHSIAMNHDDAAGQRIENGIEWFELVSTGYAKRLESAPIVVGVGLFAQGGVGAELENAMSIFGTRDRFKNINRIAKLDIGLGYEVSESLSLGMGVFAIYSDIETEVLPNTSFFNALNPPASFFGYRMKGASDTQPGFNLGLKYRVTPSTTWGVTYSSQVSLSLQGGNLISNQSALGLGLVNYRSVRLDGMKVPQELGFGLTQALNKNVTLVFEVNWIDWSKAMTVTRLTASDPNNGAALPVLNVNIKNEWRDQYVVSVAVLYDLASRWSLRAGYNYGRNPIPDENLSPILASITEHHITAGFRYTPQKDSRFDFSLEYSIPNERTYTNNSSLVGPDTSTRTELLGLHFGWSQLF